MGEPVPALRMAGIVKRFAGVTALDVYCAQTLSRESPHPLPPMQDYSSRTGYPRGIEQSHGAARDFEVPRDMRAPEALQSWLRAPRGTPATGLPLERFIVERLQ